MRVAEHLPAYRIPCVERVAPVGGHAAPGADECVSRSAVAAGSSAGGRWATPGRTSSRAPGPPRPRREPGRVSRPCPAHRRRRARARRQPASVGRGRRTRPAPRTRGRRTRRPTSRSESQQSGTPRPGSRSRKPGANHRCRPTPRPWPRSPGPHQRRAFGPPGRLAEPRRGREGGHRADAVPGRRPAAKPTAPPIETPAYDVGRPAARSVGGGRAPRGEVGDGVRRGGGVARPWPGRSQPTTSTSLSSVPAAVHRRRDVGAERRADHQQYRPSPARRRAECR